ncbi:MAG: hypothetical protein ACOYOK_14945 [Pseudobdellovibrionaceae bacterium]
MKKQFSMALIGSAFSLIATQAHATLTYNSDDSLVSISKDKVTAEQAEVLTDMINRGFIVFDKTTGQWILKSSMLKILKDYGYVDKGEDVMASGCGSCHQTDSKGD